MRFLRVSLLLLSASCGGCPDRPVLGPCGACPAEKVCRYLTCMPEPAPCAATADCSGDFCCDTSARECLPWGVGPCGDEDDGCTREVVGGVFFPEVQCEWLGPPPGDPYPDHRNVLGTPMAANFRGFGDPELGHPSIVFISYNFHDGGAESCTGGDARYTGVIRVIDGRSCEQQASIAAPLPIASTSVALGDLTGDAIPEIVAARVGGGLAAWQIQPDGSFALLWQTVSTYGAGTCNWTGPSIHDLDDDGSPEVLLYAAVFDAQGNERYTGLDPNTGLVTGYVPVVADVDRDGEPELVTGAGIYGWTGAAWQLESELGPNAQTAAADLGTYGANPANGARGVLDGVAEVVTVAGGTVRAFTVGGRSIFSQTHPGGGGGAPTIADFDGDGRNEVAAAGGSGYTVFDPDCLGSPQADTCASLRTDGILWTQPSQDLSSGRTGSAAFDFEGDGAAEVVYADECFTRIYEGKTGAVLYSRHRNSCTFYENPIVADTDADFGAEIVIPSNTNCSVTCPGVDPIFDGVRCFDASDCPGAGPCRRDGAGDPTGRCRCAADGDCGGDGFVCLDPIAGPSAQGKVCRASHPGPGTGSGVRVIGDPRGRWVGTRPIWNQHAYAVTHVADSGAIPRTSQWERNWDRPGLNNFRQNAPRDGAGKGTLPDLTVKSGAFACGAPPGTTARLTAEVCNRGSRPVGAGVAVAVSAGEVLACSTTTDGPIFPGRCRTVACGWSGAGPTPTDLTVKADDDGSGGGDRTECREGNNALVIAGVSCP